MPQAPSGPPHSHLARGLVWTWVVAATGCVTSFPELRESSEDAGSDAPADSASSGGSDGGCASGRKLCGASCVSDADPAYGCGAQNCNPCALKNATASCDGQKCSVAKCSPGYEDCDGLSKNGCEAQICLPIPIAKNQTNPWTVRVDATHVYWASAHGAAGIQRLRHEDLGQAPETLSAEAADGDMILEGEFVYWANASLGLVRRLPKADPKATPVVLGTGDRPIGVAVDDQYVYWANAGATGASQGSIARAAKGGSGGASTLLASGLPTPWLVALDASTVYFTSYEDGSVYAVAKTGGPFRKLAFGHKTSSSSIRGWGIAVDASFVYWRDEGFLRKIAVDASVVGDAGSDLSVDLTSTDKTARFLALRGSDIAWVSGTPSRVLLGSTATLPGTQAQVVAASNWRLHGVEVDEQVRLLHDYGSGESMADGGVYKIAR
ncbi:MAG: hypothetical protein U0263_33905 [Polyangiaceae bacterium]